MVNNCSVLECLQFAGLFGSLEQSCRISVRPGATRTSVCCLKQCYLRYYLTPLLLLHMIDNGLIFFWGTCTVPFELKSFVTESQGLSKQPPLELVIAQSTECMKLMSKAKIGSCAFANLSDYLHWQKGKVGTWQVMRVVDILVWCRTGSYIICNSPQFHCSRFFMHF